MINLGEFDVSQVIDFAFTSRGSTGAPTTLSGSPAVLVYKGSSTTESASTGITLTVDFDSRTGMNHVTIDMSQNNTFFATANDFDVVITSGTVGGVSVVGEVVAHFSIRNRAALYPTTAGRTLLVDASGLVTTIAGTMTLTTTTTNLTNNTPTAGTLTLNNDKTGYSGVMTAGTLTLNNDKTGYSGVMTAGTLTLNNDKTGYSTTSGTVTAGTVGLVTTTTNLTNLPAITAGTITLVNTATNLTNAPTAGDFTATMKASITAAVPTAAANAAATAAQITTDHGTGSYYTNTGIIAGAVWDVVIADHLTTGTTGKALSSAGGGGGGGPFGPGSDNCTLTFTSNGTPIRNAQTWLTGSAVPTDIIAGTLSTNDDGQVTYLLDAGSTYFMWLIKAGEEPIRGEPFVAVAD